MIAEPAGDPPTTSSCVLGVLAAVAFSVGFLALMFYFPEYVCPAMACLMILGVVSSKTSKDPEVVARIAAQAARNKLLFGQLHEFGRAEAKHYRGEHREFYQQTYELLLAKRFLYLEEIVDLTLLRLGENAPPVMVMVSPDGKTVVTAYAERYWPIHNLGEDAVHRAYDLITEYSDGTFLITTNSSSPWGGPREFHVRRESQDRSLDDLLSLHSEFNAMLRSTKRGTNLVVIRTLDEMLESEHRRRRIQMKFDEQEGLFDPKGPYYDSLDV